MVFKVALVGHSQLPYIDDYDDVEFEQFKIGGARIKTFTEGSNYERICSNEWDCVILFLGGNDLCDHHDAYQMVTELMTFVNDIRAPLKLVTEVEKRTYSSQLEDRYNTTTQQYMRLASTANNKLKHRKKSGAFRLIHSPSSYNINSRDGGIHFGEIAYRSLVERYVGAINRARDA